MNRKRVLITGGAGFIGSHLTKRWVQMGADVSVIVKYKSIIDNIRLSSIWRDISVIEADLRNIDSLRQLSSYSNFDIVFHLAAYNHVGDSFLHVNEALMSNAVATANLLEYVPDYGRFVYTSTSEVYGYQHSVPFQEDAHPFPISPYAIGKYAGELYSRMKRHQTNQPIVCIRPFNTFGPYQSDRAVIPELIIKCLLGGTIETTEGLQTREFNYVDNIIDGFVAAAEIDPPPEQVINIGSNHEIAIRDLIQKIHNLTDSRSELRIGALPNRPTEIWRMCADNTRAAQILDWKPMVSFDQGLLMTINWYRKYLSVYYDRSSPLNEL
jgi:nucleoside-diphosphate-sugar epimerase